MEHAHVCELVRQHGQNPAAYLVLEDDKLLYFGQSVVGVVAYGVVGKTVVVCGDPICAPGDFVRLLSEFRQFYTSNFHHCVFLGTTDVFLEHYTQLGYHHVKYGDEARIQLSSYQLAGGKMARMRADVNHANNAGVSTQEYKPHTHRDPEIERGMQFVSEQWLEGKGSSQLIFTIGSVGLDNPMERRYFYATDAAGQMVAFHVFTPFARGYTADITHRVPNAPGGVTEKLNFDAFMAFRAEGIEWVSLGIAPLANTLRDSDPHDVNAKLLNLVYEKCNGIYGFKSLCLAKSRYGPTLWAPGHLVFSTRHLTPRIAYAIVKIQTPGSVRGLLRRKK